jgi:phosphoribosyl-AMP cyclohydrolase / phosphoribosyl-ATP pyrophosphohydrolase
MMTFDINAINFDKMGGLVPVCVQDAKTLSVLMMGFMNLNALKTTLETKRVTFYSRTKARLWTKGETSGNYLEVIRIALDCDNDSLLILANPIGPSCHLGTQSCFALKEAPHSLGASLSMLMETLKSRIGIEGSYTQQLLNEGVTRIAQKVGEEGVEVALAAVVGTNADIINEVSDLFYHVLELLLAKQVSLEEISAELQKRRMSQNKASLI